jgi:hypothetical protein
MYGRHATEIIAYTYEGAAYCVAHTDTDESHYDYDAPNPVFASDTDFIEAGFVCSICGEELS